MIENSVEGMGCLASMPGSGALGKLNAVELSCIEREAGRNFCFDGREWMGASPVPINRNERNAAKEKKYRTPLILHPGK